MDPLIPGPFYFTLFFFVELTLWILSLVSPLWADSSKQSANYWKPYIFWRFTLIWVIANMMEGYFFILILIRFPTQVWFLGNLYWKCWNYHTILLCASTWFDTCAIMVNRWFLPFHSNFITYFSSSSKSLSNLDILIMCWHNER